MTAKAPLGSCCRQRWTCFHIKWKSLETGHGQSQSAALSASRPSSAASHRSSDIQDVMFARLSTAQCPDSRGLISGTVSDLLHWCNDEASQMVSVGKFVLISLIPPLAEKMRDALYSPSSGCGHRVQLWSHRFTWLWFPGIRLSAGSFAAFFLPTWLLDFGPNPPHCASWSSHKSVMIKDLKGCEFPYRI